MDASPVERHRVYYKGEGGDFPKSKGEGVGFPKGEGGGFPKSGPWQKGEGVGFPKGEGVSFPKGVRWWLPRVRAVASPNTQGCPEC